MKQGKKEKGSTQDETISISLSVNGNRIHGNKGEQVDFDDVITVGDALMIIAAEDADKLNLLVKLATEQKRPKGRKLYTEGITNLTSKSYARKSKTK